MLAGVIEAFGARRARRSLRKNSTVVLHPLTRHRLRRVRDPLPARALYYVSLFFGFFFVIYVGILLLKTIRSAVAFWL
jgi:hypothetical protein